MADHPIIFSASMVRALLAGRKTMTRRLAWRRDPKWGDCRPIVGTEADYMLPSPWQKVKPGDRLWVRESITRFQTYGASHPTCHFQADDTGVPSNGFMSADASGRAIWVWKGDKLSSIHMPRKLSRLTLVVTETKIERLLDISEADANAEGCGLYVPGHGFIETADLAEGYSNYLAPLMGFEIVWSELHGAESWRANPEVVALSFTVHKHNIDAEAS